MASENMKLLTVPQAAEALTLRPKTVRAWIAARRIACVRLGSAVRIPASEIVRLIEGGTIPSRLRRPQRKVQMSLGPQKA
jgi:excisionase family DNA binding protein